MEFKKYLFIMMFIALVGIVNANQVSQVDVETNITVICLNDGYCSASSYCNINVINPTGAVIVAGENMTNQVSFHNYTLTPDALGAYAVKGFCLDLNESQEIDFVFDVTPTGIATPEGVPTFQGIFLIILFGISVVFLVYSSKFGETAFKLFFLLTSFIFMFATLITGYMISSSTNVLGSINSTTLSLIYVMGAILVILFVYFLIRQTINALDLYNIKKGRAWQVGSGKSVGGYNTNKAY